MSPKKPKLFVAPVKAAVTRKPVWFVTVEPAPNVAVPGASKRTEAVNVNDVASVCIT
jgi:hypothetical protein